MKILKFGGTSVANSERIKCVIGIILNAIKSEKRLAVVVSAFGGVTDKLITMSEMAANGDDDYKKILNELQNLAKKIATDLIKGQKKNSVTKTLNEYFKELESLLNGLYLLRCLYPETLDYIMSFGERVSAYVIAEAIKEHKVKSEFLDARNLVKTDNNFGNTKVQIKKTYSNIKSHFRKNKNLQIITGFIGSTDSGKTTTLGRGGSDYTAALFAAALDAKELQIWTDVDGVMTADPRKVKNAFPIKNLTYEEAMEMSHFGAKVLYPPTMQPIMDKKIPIRILNTFSPIAEETLISVEKERSPFPIKAITSIESIALLLIQGSGLIGIVGASERIFRSLSRAKVNVILISQASSEHSICLAVNPKDMQKAKQAIEEEFELEIKNHQVNKVNIEEDLSIIAIIGENMKNMPGTAGEIFQVLGDNKINVIAIAQGSSELNISVVIPRKDETKALKAIHEKFFFSDTKKIHVFLLGTGLIGSTLLSQIQGQMSTFWNRANSLDIRLVAIANSKKWLFKENGISLKDWDQSFSKEGEKYDFSVFVKNMIDSSLPNRIFVDCTASEEISHQYEKILEAGISIVTPNKKANSGEGHYYLRLKQAAAKSGAKFLYETNVGAGLPVIATLRSLQNIGDKIVSIEAVLSGTLSYIFNTYDGSVPFSEVVKTAKEKGFTEPDPRDDLNGMDVARKLLILAREAGEIIEPADIKVENLIPKDCRKVESVEDFFEKLKQHDEDFAEKAKAAKKEGKKLCYIAKFDGKNAAVSLQSIDDSHPFYNLSGSDNIVSYVTERYCAKTPLVVKGPGAGAEVTAAGVLSDLLEAAGAKGTYPTLSKREFERKISNNELVIALIGMSNIGKSYWSKKLAGLGFEHIDCDKMIEESLVKQNYFKNVQGLAAVASWLGYPYDERFERNQQAYLRNEREIMNDVIHYLDQFSGKNIAIDTTGSFIHAGKAAYLKFKKRALFVYIEAPEKMKNKMLKDFMNNPKPVLWGDTFEKKKNETDRQALERCYSKLLDFRARLYEEYSDVTLTADEVSDKDPEKFLELIKNKL